MKSFEYSLLIGTFMYGFSLIFPILHPESLNIKIIIVLLVFAGYGVYFMDYGCSKKNRNIIFGLSPTRLQ